MTKHHKKLNDDNEISCNQQQNCSCENNCSCDNKAEEYLLMAQRLQADFDNYRKKVAQQITDARIDGKIQALSAIIPSLDSFNQAKKVITDDKILEGVKLIEQDILTALTQIGVTKIDAVGKPFDPNFHNALATNSNPDFDNDVVLDEYQAGYMLNNKIIRYSQVIVNKKEV